MSGPTDPDRGARHALALTSAALALAVLAACGGGAKPPAGPGAGGPPPAMPVSVVKVSVQKLPVLVETVGTLEGVREVEVRARVAGVLQKQLVREGEPVKAGAVLFQIERAPYEIAFDAARATVAQAEARIEQARRENARLAALVAEKAISQREADDASTNLKTAEAALASARVQLRDAQLNLDYTQVTAPISGVAQRAQRSEGTLVSPVGDAGLLTTLVQTNPIRVRFALTEAEAAQLRGGRGSQVRLIGPDGKVLPTAGRLDFAGTVVDPRLGTVQMRAELPNPDGALLPGQFVRAQLVTGEQEGFLVPQAAVMSGDQGRFVWVIGADGTAVPKPVQAGGWQGSDWVIRSGLAAGDRVITDNLIKLRPGAPVQEAAAAAPPASAASN
jgi:membrane fusion protein (multidrug efflux system)